jgi:hypothetical protein
MTVTGMSMRPANTRALAPVNMFWVEVSFGSTLLPALMVVGMPFAVLLATSCRNVCRLVKYSAEPNPVRRADGTVPRHSEVIGCGPARIDRRTGTREELRDCCTRVLRRSAGCRSTAEETPDAKPATK